VGHAVAIDLLHLNQEIRESHDDGHLIPQFVTSGAIRKVLTISVDSRASAAIRLNNLLRSATLLVLFVIIFSMSET